MVITATGDADHLCRLLLFFFVGSRARALQSSNKNAWKSTNAIANSSHCLSESAERRPDNTSSIN